MPSGFSPTPSAPSQTQTCAPLHRSDPFTDSDRSCLDSTRAGIRGSPRADVERLFTDAERPFTDSDLFVFLGGGWGLRLQKCAAVPRRARM